MDTLYKIYALLQKSKIYKILRIVIVSAFILLIAIYSILYVCLSIPSIQNSIKGIGETELSKLLNADVSIESVSISPFNKVTANNVAVTVSENDTVLKVSKLGAGISLYNLAKNKRFVFTYAEIIGLDCRLKKQSPQSPLNIQPIIDALSPKDKKKEPTKYDLKIYNIVIRKSKASFDIESAKRVTSKFDKNHIQISNLTADIAIPRLKNDDYSVSIKRLSLKEQCGLQIQNISANAEINNQAIRLTDFVLELPNSRISPEDIEIPINGLKNIKNDIAEIPLELRISNSYVDLYDLSGLVPLFNTIHDKINITMAVSGTLTDLNVPLLSLSSERGTLAAELAGTFNNVSDLPNLSYSVPYLKTTVSTSELATILADKHSISSQLKDIMRNCQRISLSGEIEGNINRTSIDSKIASNVGNIAINAKLFNDTLRNRFNVTGNIVSENINIGRMLGKTEFITDAGVDITIDGARTPSGLTGQLDGIISHATIKGYTYNDLSITATADKKDYSAMIKLIDDNINLLLESTAYLDAENSEFTAKIQASDINPATLNLYKKFPDKKLAFDLDATLVGNDIDNIAGYAFIDNISYADSAKNGVFIDEFHIMAENDSINRHIALRSDVINGDIEGICNFKSIVSSMKAIVQKAIPSAFSTTETFELIDNNNFTFNFTISENEQLCDLFNTPVRPLNPIYINGQINTIDQYCTLSARVPYLQQKNKLIENSSLYILLNGKEPLCETVVKTTFPSKKGPFALTTDIDVTNDRIDSDISWVIENPHSFNGSVNTSALLSRDDNRNIAVDVAINPSDIVVNDTIWVMEPSTITYADKIVSISEFEAHSDKQYIKIDGTASDNPEDILTLDLKGINLDFIFETLAISNVAFGGTATGKFYASNLFTKQPSMMTPNLYVDDFAYNQTILGDTNIESHWDNETLGITLDADIAQANGLHTFVKGAIYPTMDSLYLDFDVQKTNVRFLLPYMSAFTSDISGTASGKGTLFGNFKRINFKGDVLAEDLHMKIDYLNTVYHCTDSIHILPDYISLDGITLYDKFGNTALLGGNITHEAFHNAAFDIAITNARNFLCYDTNENINPIWYGTIFGNGSAFIVGEPGVINIDVNMSSATGSKFTFVMSDEEAAGDYNFITIVDRNKKEEADTDTIPIAVRMLKEQKKEENSTPTALNILLQAEINPQVQLILVMDPIGGDKIRATGSGNLRLGYKSIDDELEMRGKYTLERGAYNFTLQDIIVKDFTISEGSSITFNGNPYTAELDISAIYQVNANLTDLDESFALDKELNRTSVPVQAVLYARGDMSQPNISFDLAFPTLTQDAYRKVKSIVSTEDMMNRQIIYLIALNKFYTPEYMGNSNSNNEFTNVASSTISSKLGSMLGQISENWTIAPNFRSNKGDFSDVEVDVALSSQLLNNRLLLNGNFGYRDNSMNANSSNFIGDFDIEYLLTQNGNIRLKAYNHYNDQNYYVKSALTTQGVGIVFKYDFDKPFEFLKKKQSLLKIPSATIDSIPVDSISPAIKLPNDSVSITTEDIKQ